MFEIVNTDALVTNINPRAELHGEETRLACDIKLEFTVSNQMLTRLDPQLLPALYQKQPGEEAGQGFLEVEDNFLPHVRFPMLGVIPWTYEGVGYTFMLLDERLLDDNNVIEVHDCKLNKIGIECQEGGTVKLTMRVQAQAPEEDIGALCHYLRQEARISLVPPKVQEPADDEQLDMEEAG